MTTRVIQRTPNLSLTLPRMRRVQEAPGAERPQPEIPPFPCPVHYLPLNGSFDDVVGGLPTEVGENTGFGNGVVGQSLRAAHSPDSSTPVDGVTLSRLDADSGGYMSFTAALRFMAEKIPGGRKESWDIDGYLPWVGVVDIYWDNIAEGGTDYAGIVITCMQDQFSGYNRTPVFLWVEAYSEIATVEVYETMEIGFTAPMAWDDIAITSDGNSVSVYRGAHLVGTLPVPGVRAPGLGVDVGWSYAGLYQDPTDCDFRVDYFALWDRVLTSDELAKVVASRVPLTDACA